MIKRGQNRDERPLRLLIVDALDHSRDSLVEFFQLQENLDVIGTTAVAADAIQLSQRLKPDTVIMDINLSDIDGFAATRQLLALDSPPAVILLLVHRRVQDIQQARAAGASACIEKSAGVDVILDALYALSPTTKKESFS